MIADILRQSRLQTVDLQCKLEHMRGKPVLVGGKQYMVDSTGRCNAVEMSHAQALLQNTAGWSTAKLISPIMPLDDTGNPAYLTAPQGGTPEPALDCLVDELPPLSEVELARLVELDAKHPMRIDDAGDRLELTRRVSPELNAEIELLDDRAFAHNQSALNPERAREAITRSSLHDKIGDMRSDGRMFVAAQAAQPTDIAGKTVAGPVEGARMSHPTHAKKVKRR